MALWNTLDSGSSMTSGNQSVPSVRYRVSLAGPGLGGSPGNWACTMSRVGTGAVGACFLGAGVGAAGTGGGLGGPSSPEQLQTPSPAAGSARIAPRPMTPTDPNRYMWPPARSVTHRDTSVKE